jgi:hypothetical protein
MPTERRRGADFGAVRRFGAAHAIGAVLVITLGTGWFAWDAWRGRNTDIATAKAWAIDGPPCPELTAAQWAAKHEQAPKIIDYDGVKLGRWAGDASCSDVHAGGGTAAFTIDKVCQFTNPMTLTVVSKAGTFYFLPDVGQPASLILHKDRPRCVMASKFTRATE